jgi:hypothetical protein
MDSAQRRIQHVMNTLQQKQQNPFDAMCCEMQRTSAEDGPIAGFKVNSCVSAKYIVLLQWRAGRGTPFFIFYCFALSPPAPWHTGCSPRSCGWNWTTVVPSDEALSLRIGRHLTPLPPSPPSLPSLPPSLPPVFLISFAIFFWPVFLVGVELVRRGPRGTGRGR